MILSLVSKDLIKWLVLQIIRPITLNLVVSSLIFNKIICRSQTLLISKIINFLLNFEQLLFEIWWIAALIWCSSAQSIKFLVRTSHATAVTLFYTQITITHHSFRAAWWIIIIVSSRTCLLSIGIISWMSICIVLQGRCWLPMLILLLLFFLVVRCCSVGSDFAHGIFISATLATTLLPRFQLIYVCVKLLSGIG